MRRRRLWARSIGLGIGVAIAYGVVHDQISVRLSPPYLMEWHRRIVASREPAMVALAWGVVATWWFGLILGAALAGAATLGKRPSAPWRWIVGATGFVFAIAALSATVAFDITRSFGLEMPDVLGPIYTSLSRPERLAFTQTLAMHEASYDAAAIATLIAAGWTWSRRKVLNPPISVAVRRP